jgi:anti-sigma factor RsiW
VNHATLEAAVPGESIEIDDAEIPDEVIAQVSDFLDGALAGKPRDEVARKVASDPLWQRAHRELEETRSYLSGLSKTHAPSGFAQDVEETIHQRSAGRFFAKRTLGDRVPFGAILIVALLVIAVIGFVLWSSPTGSLKRDHLPIDPPAAGSAIEHP